jgi:hypothetical protein
MVDILHDTRRALRCCFISKSWVSRTPKHLFRPCQAPFRGRPPVVEEDVHISLGLSCVVSHHPIGRLSSGYRRDRFGRGWLDLGVFSHCTVEGGIWKATSMTRRSLSSHSTNFRSHSNFSASCLPSFYSQVFNVVRSFPLEDLTLIGRSCTVDADQCVPRGLQSVHPSTSPAFTGSLDLAIPEGMVNITRLRLGPLSGLRFRELAHSWIEDEGPGEQLNWYQGALTPLSV